ncbi:MAG: TonB-dependent receptor [Pseudomonadota bacterium]
MTAIQDDLRMTSCRWQLAAFARRQASLVRAGLLGFAMALSSTAHAGDDLFDLSLEELVNLEVTSVSRKSERLSDVSAAVFVITQADLQRHGIRSIPEALRLAPGLAVLQIDGNKWSISSRGFGGRFANKLLVLMDGRVLYTPLFSGVFWDVQDTLIEEIERIEVIRGPGAASWGTNAVNGVINIITRKASASDKPMLIGGLEPQQAQFAAGRFSGQLGDRGAFRAFAQYRNGEGNVDLAGDPTGDEWEQLRAGVRADWSTNRLALQATLEGYEGRSGQTQPIFQSAPPLQRLEETSAEVGGLFAIVGLSRSSGVNNTSAQLTFDYTDRETVDYVDQRTMVSLELQHRRGLGRHTLVTGGLARADVFRLAASGVIEFSDASSTYAVASAFIQDDISLTEDNLTLTLGARIESNELSPRDLEWMPTARLAWKINPRHTAWAALTRAVRTPSLGDLTSRVLDVLPPTPVGDPTNPFPVPFRVATAPNPEFRSETLLASELGLRGQLSPRLTYDLALYRMDYDRLRDLDMVGETVCLPSGVSLAADPTCLALADSVATSFPFTNGAQGTVTGGELVLDWQAQENWRLRGSVSYADESIDDVLARSYPLWQASLRTEWSPLDSIDLAMWWRYVGEVEATNTSAFTQANLHLRWRYGDHWSMSLGVRNLLRSQTLESVSEFSDVVPTAIQRTAFINVRHAF